LGVKVGDRFTLSGQATHEQMRNRTMTVAGIYDVGIPDIEKRMVYISLAEAQSLYDLSGQSTEVIITLRQIGQEAAVVAAISPDLSGYEIATWETNFPELKTAVQTKGAAMSIFGVVMLVIAGIGILNLLLIAVYERTREIGLMGALGMKPAQISVLFLLEGAMMGLVGVAFGVVLGLIINISIRQVGMDFSQFTSMTDYTALISTRIYPSFGLERVLQRTLTALVVVLLASFYPAREAARHEPAEALHYV
jgi:ABC-type lipoprotein release transport system permease subunit